MFAALVFALAAPSDLPPRIVAPLPPRIVARAAVGAWIPLRPLAACANGQCETTVRRFAPVRRAGLLGIFKR